MAALSTIEIDLFIRSLIMANYNQLEQASLAVGLGALVLTHVNLLGLVAAYH